MLEALPRRYPTDLSDAEWAALEPSEGPLHRRAPQDDLEALGLVVQAVASEVAIAMLRYLGPPAAIGFEPAREGAGIGAIGPQHFQT